MPITSISLLELVVPSVEVYVKHHHGPRRQASQQKPKNSRGVYSKLLLILQDSEPSTVDTLDEKMNSDENLLLVV